MQPQYWSIADLPGLKPSEQKLLQQQQISNTQELLARAKDSSSRKNLAISLQLNQKYLSKWLALADLARIPSVGNRYCGLLLHAGIISVAQLAQTPFYRLHRQVLRLQVATLRRKDLAPPVELVKRWVEEARQL